MEYFIAHILSDRAEAYHRRIVHELQTNFDVVPPPSHIPSHVTFKYKFNARTISPVEDILAELTDKHDPSTFRLRGFKSFQNSWVYLNATPDRGVMRFHCELDQRLHTHRWIEWGNIDGKRIDHHASVCHLNGNRYLLPQILSHLSRHEEVIRHPFEHISILRKNQGSWEEYRTFGL